MATTSDTFIYDGSQGGRDLYHLLDKESNVIAWAVQIGDDPRNVIPGTIRNLGYIGRARNIPNAVLSDEQTTTYQMLDDAGNLLRWQVRTGDPYQSAIPGTLQNLGAASNAATLTPTAPTTSAPDNPANVYANPLATTPEEMAALSVGNLPKAADSDFYNLPTGQTSVGTTISRNTMDPRIKYAGSQGDRDFYTLVDESGNLISWQVAIGDDPRAVIEGTLVNRGPSIGDPAYTTPPPVTMTPPVAVGPTQTAEPIAPQQPMGGIIYTPASQRMVASSSHVYEGSFNGVRDFYSMIDEAGNKITWAVPFNGDSRDIIPGTLQNEGGALPTSSDKTTVDSTKLPTVVPATKQADTSKMTTTGIGSTAAGSNATNGVPGSVLTANNTVSTGQPASATPSARKVGTSGGRDTYQLIDEGGSLIQWQVAAGASFQDAIAGTIQNLGTPSPAAATAINTPSASATGSKTAITTAATGDTKSTLVVLAGLAAAVLNVIK
jgi:transposase